MDKKDRIGKKNMKKRSEMEYAWLKFHAREIDNEKRKSKGRYIVNQKLEGKKRRSINK